MKTLTHPVPGKSLTFNAAFLLTLQEAAVWTYPLLFDAWLCSSSPQQLGFYIFMAYLGACMVMMLIILWLYGQLRIRFQKVECPTDSGSYKLLLL